MPRYRSFPLVGLILLIATISGCGANQAKPGPATPDPALSICARQTRFARHERRGREIHAARRAHARGIGAS